LARPVVVIALPPKEFVAVAPHLSAAGYDPIGVGSCAEMEALLLARDDIGVAILDGESDLDTTIEMYALLHDGGRNVPALIVVTARTLDVFSIAGRTRANDEYFKRPYTADSLAWRVEALMIRAGMFPEEQAVPAAGAEAPATMIDDNQRGRLVVVFNPKGGVGKTTIAVNLSAALHLRKGKSVLLVDCDIVTGHVASSLGMENVRTVADAWSEDLAGGSTPEDFAEIAAPHPNGLSVLVLAESPLHTEILEPRRVADAITAATGSYEWVVVDMHPDYGPLNQIIFERADRIIVPVTPDVPAIRAAVQFREVAFELGIRDRVSMVVNRANSGVSVADMERTVGMPAMAEIRSAGLLFVRAANEGRSAVERFPKEKVIEDVDVLATRLLNGEAVQTGRQGGFLSIFGKNANSTARAS
jgi:pilus assembly protein CpaE